MPQAWQVLRLPVKWRRFDGYRFGGSVSAAFTAELGTMLVTEEIMALEVMAISPISYLVVPRFIAMIVMLPCLTVLADAIGMIGGYVVGTGAIGIRSAIYIQNTIDSLLMKDILSGLIKSVVFAIIIAMVGLLHGFRGSRRGRRGGQVDHDLRGNVADQHYSCGLPFYGDLLPVLVNGMHKTVAGGNIYRSEKPCQEL